MKQSRARTQRGGSSTAVTYSLCDQTCVYSMECLPPGYFYPLCVWGQGCVGDKCFFVLLWVSHALNSGCQAWGQYLLRQVSGPMFLSVPELWDTPLTSAFWHPYLFSFLILAVYGWSLWTVLSYAEFPHQGRVVTKRMGKRGLTLDRPYPYYGVT